MTSKAPFTFPLLAGDIAEFCHPSPESPFHRAHFRDGDLTAGNGFIAIRAMRGRWIESDFTPAPDGFGDRMGTLPWHRIPPPSPEWRDLDEIRGIIYASAPLDPWTPDHKSSPSPSPVWRIAHHHRIRLSHIQLLARLPRCKVFCGHSMKDDPLFISFSSGCALMPPDRRLETQSREIFVPQYDCLTKQRRDRYATQPRFPNTVLNWPPPEPLDD